MLSAEIIAIGSELLAPDRTDTNSLWLTDQLNRMGIDVKLKTIVGDDDARLEEVVKDAVKRSRVVISTGGLGPTEDDITRKVVARALGKRLSLDENDVRESRAGAAGRTGGRYPFCDASAARRRTGRIGGRRKDRADLYEVRKSADDDSLQQQRNRNSFEGSRSN